MNRLRIAMLKDVHDLV